MAELDRSSFVKNLQSISSEEHEISFGLSSNDLNNTFGFKVNLENLQQAKADIQVKFVVFFPTYKLSMFDTYGYICNGYIAY